MGSFLVVVCFMLSFFNNHFKWYNKPLSAKYILFYHKQTKKAIGNFKKTQKTFHS